MTTAADLRDLRRRYDWSQEWLARELGVSRSSVARWESGQRPVPKVVGLAFCWLSACYRDLEEEDEAKHPQAWPVDSRGRMIDG